MTTCELAGYDRRRSVPAIDLLVPLARPALLACAIVLIASSGGAGDAQAQFSFFYRSATSGKVTPYDPNSPPSPAEIAMTTTDRGATVPYIVREETGTLNRSIYRIAVLFDPARAWAPWQPQPGWNGKL